MQNTIKNKIVKLSTNGIIVASRIIEDKTVMKEKAIMRRTKRMYHLKSYCVRALAANIHSLMSTRVCAAQATTII